MSKGPAAVGRAEARAPYSHLSPRRTDIMTHITWRLSGLPANRVFGSGTYLDSSRCVVVAVVSTLICLLHG